MSTPSIDPYIFIIDMKTGKLTRHGFQILQAGLPDAQTTLSNKTFSDFLRVAERATDPANPAEGLFVMWMSDGTGLGDDGDVMVKITAGGVTKTTTLIDFSTLP